MFEELEGGIPDLNGIDMWNVAYQIDKCGYFFLSIHMLFPYRRTLQAIAPFG